MSLSASTPQLRRKSSDLCRSSSFVSSHPQAPRDRDTSRRESPLYSNWQEAHLLPLQHFIMNHNSGYRSGAAHDSDSPSEHSDSGSESLTGHEPDNEDSDQSDGSYIPHRLPTPSHRVECEYLNLPSYANSSKFSASHGSAAAATSTNTKQTSTSTAPSSHHHVYNRYVLFLFYFLIVFYLFNLLIVAREICNYNGPHRKEQAQHQLLT